MAATLYRAGLISSTVTLAQMVTSETLAAYLGVVDAADAANRTTTFTGGEPMAIRPYAILLNGLASESAQFALAQFSVRRASPGLSEERVLRLTQLIQPDALAKIAGVVDDWRAIASDPSVIERTRLRYGNLAVGMAVQMELLLQPRQLVALQFDDDGCPVLTDAVAAVGFVPLSGYTMELLAWRRALRVELDAPDTGLLFPGADEEKPHTGASLCMSWTRALRQYPTLLGLDCSGYAGRWGNYDPARQTRKCPTCGRSAGRPQCAGRRAALPGVLTGSA